LKRFLSQEMCYSVSPAGVLKTKEVNCVACRVLPPN
jgi:hypothetical protein